MSAISRSPGPAPSWESDLLAQNLGCAMGRKVLEEEQDGLRYQGAIGGIGVREELGDVQCVSELAQTIEHRNSRWSGRARSYGKPTSTVNNACMRRPGCP